MNFCLCENPPTIYEMYENFGKHADVKLQRALTISGMISIHKKPK